MVVKYLHRIWRKRISNLSFYVGSCTKELIVTRESLETGKLSEGKVPGPVRVAEVGTSARQCSCETIRVVSRLRWDVFLDGMDIMKIISSSNSSKSFSHRSETLCTVEAMLRMCRVWKGRQWLSWGSCNHDETLSILGGSPCTEANDLPSNRISKLCEVVDEGMQIDVVSFMCNAKSLLNRDQARLDLVD